MTASELLAATEALDWFFEPAPGRETSVAAALKLRRIARWAQQHVQDLQAEHARIITDCGEHGEDGKPVVRVVDGQQIVPWREECREDANRRERELYEAEIPAPPETLTAADLVGVRVPPRVVLGLGPLLADSTP